LLIPIRRKLTVIVAKAPWLRNMKSSSQKDSTITHEEHKHGADENDVKKITTPAAWDTKPVKQKYRC
jgi:hypothetical protein